MTDRNDHLEECPLCSGYMKPSGYMCLACSRALNSEGPPALTANKPEFAITEYMRAKPGKSDICSSCEMLTRCRERVRLDLWVMCEIPDELDVIMAQVSEEVVHEQARAA